MKNTLRNKMLKGLLATTAITPFVAFAPVMAEEQKAEQGKDNETVVVTARRREEALIDVPVAVTSISGRALESAGVADITEIAESAPNVTVEVSRGTNTTLSAFIRGVGQQDPVAGFEAGVGLYLDDVYMNRPQAAVLDVYDVQRIEVLRGPQGTLYGRNTIGGAIKYITKKLSSEPTGTIKASFGSYEQADIVGTASAPITDTLRVGGSIARLHRDGFGKNLVNGKENYNKEVISGRLSLEWEPNENIFVRLSGDATHDESNARQGHRLIAGLLTPNTPVLSNVYDTRAGLYTPAQEINASGMALSASWKLNDTFTLKSISAYRQDVSTTPIDFDSLQSADVDVPAIYKNHQASQELQLQVSGSKLNGVFGAYYLDANAMNVFDVVLGTTSPIFLPGLAAHTYGDVSTKTWSVFADFTYDFTDQFSVSLGGRYTNDQREAVIQRYNVLNGPVPELGGKGTQLGGLTSNFNNDAEFKKFNPKATVSWEPNATNTVYASYSQGFKGGGFDPRGLTTAAKDSNGNGTVDAAEIYDFMKFDPETVDSYEIGWKTNMLDGRLFSSLAIFQADYQDVQIPGSASYLDPNTNTRTFVGVTTNAASATFKGLEWEGSFNLMNDMGGAGRFDANWSLGLIDASFDKYIDKLGNDISKTAVFQNTPDTTGTLGLSYRNKLGAGTMGVMANVSYKSKTSQFGGTYRIGTDGKQFYSPEDIYLDQDAYSTFDMSVTWDSDDRNWSVGLHGKNLTDERYITSGYTYMSYDKDGKTVASTLGKEGVLTAFYGNPKTVTATIVRRF